MPDWLVPTILVVFVLTIWLGLAYRNSNRQVGQIASQRSNVSHAEFRSMTAGDMSAETADWLWSTVSSYLAGWKPELAPHPDDDLKDLPIDEGDWSMDWLRDFANRHERDPRDWPDWPQGRMTTIRNFGRWLDCGLR